MFKRMMKEVKEFVKECNSPKMKKLRQEAAGSCCFYNAGFWIQY